MACGSLGRSRRDRRSFWLQRAVASSGRVSMPRSISRSRSMRWRRSQRVVLSHSSRSASSRRLFRSSPIQPPETWDAWKTLVRSFLDALVADERFGSAAISDWWFEVWNEPNEGRFWQGTPDDYLALYRATSEAVAEAGVSIRLGGPAIAYKPQVEPESGAPWIDHFLRFIAADSTLQCDFISLHRKGTVGDDPPDPRRLYAAAISDGGSGTRHRPRSLQGNDDHQRRSR